MRRFALVLSAVYLTADQALKAYTVGAVPPAPAAQEVIPGVLSLSYLLNPGMAWGLLSEYTVPLAVLRAGVGLLLLMYLWRTPSLARLRGVALGLIAAGALGNALDVLTRGAVVDMLSSHTLSALYRPLAGQDFPIFNLADVGVVGGCLYLVVLEVWRPRPGVVSGQ